MSSACSIILIGEDKVIPNPRLQAWVIRRLRDGILRWSKPGTAFCLTQGALKLLKKIVFKYGRISSLIYDSIQETMNLLAALILYVVGAQGAQHIPISKGSALLEIGAITITTETTSIHWVRTALNITKRPPSIPTGAGIAYSGASRLSRNTASPYSDVTLKATTHCNPLYPNMTLVVTTPGILSIS